LLVVFACFSLFTGFLSSKALTFFCKLDKAFFLRKWFGASVAKKADDSPDSRQGQEPTARIEALLN
jgi:hypothetical protein